RAQTVWPPRPRVPHGVYDWNDLRHCAPWVAGSESRSPYSQIWNISQIQSVGSVDVEAMGASMTSMSSMESPLSPVRCTSLRKRCHREERSAGRNRKPRVRDMMRWRRYPRGVSPVRVIVVDDEQLVRH